MAGPGGREVGRVSIRVLPDTSAFGRSLEKYLTRMERTLRVEIPAVVDADGIGRDVRRIANVAEKTAKLELPASVDDTGLNARITALAKRLSGHEVTLNVDVDKGLARARSGFAALGRSMARLIVPVSLASTVPTLLGRGAAALTAAGAVNLLPAALGAVAIGGAAAMLAFAGFGEAMSNLGDPEKFADALENLAPAAQQTAIAVRDLRPAFEELQLDVQQQFFEGLGNTIRDVATTYLPVLQGGLRQVSAAMGAMAQKAGQALMRPESVGAVNAMLDNTAQAFRALIPAVGDFLRGFLQVGAVGATFLPGFAESVSDVADRFSTWATAAAASGQLHGVIVNALNVLQQLRTIASNVGSILVGLFNAAGASGASALGVIESITERMAGFIHSAQGSQALSQIFGGIGAAMNSIGPAATQLLSTLAVELGPVIERLGPAIGEFATQLGSTLAGAIAAASPALLTMATFLQDNMFWLGPVVIGVGALVAALSAIGPVVTFVTGLATAFQIAALAFRVLSTALLTNPFIALAAAVIAIAILIYQNWDSIKQFLAASWQWIASTAVAIWNGLASFFSGLWANITGFFVSAKNNMVSVMSSAWSTLTSTVSSGVSNVVGFIRGLPGLILSALGNLGRLLWNAGADLVNGMINGVSSMVSNLLATVRNMAASAVNTVKSWLGINSPSTVFRQLGAWTGEGFADGIERAAPNAISAAGNMARSVAAAPVASPVAPAFGGGGHASIQQAVTAGVLAGLHGSRMRVDGDGVARLVNRTNTANARR